MSGTYIDVVKTMATQPNPPAAEGVPLVTVVIVNYNRCDDLRQALASVMAQDFSPFETIVVDNVSTDASREMVRSEFPSVRLIESSRNTGMGGYTIGCRAARGAILFQMDNDSLMPSSDVLSKVVATFATAPDSVAILACRVHEYRKDRETIAELVKSIEGTQARLADGYHAGGVAFRKALMDKAGYYNEDVFLYGAEQFVQTQVLEAGFEIMYAPHILMLHKMSPVTRSSSGVYYEVRNRIWLMRKYGSIGQQMLYLPQMLVHDLAYAVHRKGARNYLNALRDGFGKLPASLSSRIAPSTAVKRAMTTIGRDFTLLRAIRRTLGRLSAKR